MPNTTWAAKVEDRTRLEADAHREPWSHDDLEFVIEFTDTERDEDLALALGRTLYALWAIQTRIRAGELTMETVRAERERAAQREVRVCSAHFVALLPTGECPFEA